MCLHWGQDRRPRRRLGHSTLPRRGPRDGSGGRNNLCRCGGRRLDLAVARFVGLQLGDGVLQGSYPSDQRHERVVTGVTRGTATPVIHFGFTTNRNLCGPIRDRAVVAPSGSLDSAIFSARGEAIESVFADFVQPATR
eukprot:scaffold21332_cov148-Isochrysis_galbana.AAC.1